MLGAEQAVHHTLWSSADWRRMVIDRGRLHLEDKDDGSGASNQE
jgi:hypothetical protein